MRLKWFGLLAFSLAFACSNADFGAVGGRGSDKSKNGDDGDDAGDDDAGDDDAGDDADVDNLVEQPVDFSKDESAAVSIFDTGAGQRRELFEFGGDAKVPAVDLLFVIDNSVSMGGILTKTSAGFTSLTSEDIFPDGTKVAVMTTMTGARGNLTATHPGISKYNGIEKEPGFLDFVDKASIEAFRGAVSAKAGKYAKDGCDAWFAPDAKNAAGDFCMLAHTQSPLHGVGCEAGITAFGQLLEKHKGDRQFRRGALLNVVFVSDTHDTGCNDADLKNNIPTLDTLKSAVKADNKVAGLKFHGFVPAKACTGEDMNGFTYHTLIDGTSGFKQDPCKLTDYAPAFKDLVKSATTQSDAEFVLSKEAKTIVAVKVDGKATTDFELSDDGATLKIDGLDPAEKHDVEVLYDY